MLIRLLQLSKCGPCQRIAPIFEQLASKYPQAVFMKVDVDKCADTAASNGVSAMPTFIFYKNRSKIGSCEGADSNVLESKIQQFYGLPEQEDTEGSPSDHMARFHWRTQKYVLRPTLNLMQKSEQSTTDDKLTSQMTSNVDALRLQIFSGGVQIDEMQAPN
ncbi:hypothetical protein TKK_0015547 [Trichogramma kaykai]